VKAAARKLRTLSTVGAIKAVPGWFLQGKPTPPGPRTTSATWKQYSKDSPILVSGLKHFHK